MKTNAMKTSNLIIAVLLLFTMSTYAQSTKGKGKTTTNKKTTAHKKKTTSKKTGTSKTEPEKTAVVSKPEIDKLAEKYKDKPTVDFSTSNGDLTGEVTIENNPEGKPQSVRISCEDATNKKALVEFLLQIISQKKQQGYKTSDDVVYDEAKIKSLLDAEEINLALKKENMYFLVKAKGDYGYRYKTTTHFSFSIETGDNERKGLTKKTVKKIDF